ncbi:hypothetical protein [Methanopyrus sp.]
MSAQEPEAPFLVAFAAYKGGTGKTTVAFNAGLEFARPRAFEVSGRPVVFFDLDPQVRNEEGGTTLSKLFDRGPFNRRWTKKRVHSGTSSVNLYVVEYDPDQEISVLGMGTGDSFRSRGLVDENSPFAPVLLAVPRSGAIPKPSLLRKVLKEVPNALRKHVERNHPELLGRYERYLSSPPLGIVDTPPANDENKDVIRILKKADLTVPVLDLENVIQLPVFCENYTTRFAVVNKIPVLRTREGRMFNGGISVVLNKILRNVPLNRDEIIEIPDRSLIRSATAFGIPVRARPDRGQGHAGYFREVARHIQLEWDRRRKKVRSRGVRGVAI